MNILTTGYLVPADAIPGSVRGCIPSFLLEQTNIREGDNQSERGRKAAYIVEQMLHLGVFSLPVQVTPITDLARQMNGIDFDVAIQTTIQVKCDYNGGHKKYGGTGNLFIQVSECNPQHAH